MVERVLYGQQSQDCKRRIPATMDIESKGPDEGYYTIIKGSMWPTGIQRMILSYLVVSDLIVTNRADQSI